MNLVYDLVDRFVQRQRERMEKHQHRVLERRQNMKEAAESINDSYFLGYDDGHRIGYTQGYERGAADVRLLQEKGKIKK